MATRYDVDVSALTNGTAGAAVAGAAKLVQQYAAVLLCELGSKPHFPDEGTSFLTAIRQGQASTETDVRAAFAFAAGKVASQLEPTLDTPDDEAFAGAELVGVSTADGTVALDVEVTNVAGDAATATLTLTLDGRSPYGLFVTTGG